MNKKKSEAKKETPKQTTIQREISISTMNFSISIKSQEPRDNLDKLQLIAEQLISKYNK